MQLTRANELEWTPLTALRDSGKDAKHLLSGEEGAPDNYRLVMVREQGGVKSTGPRHKHTFDQLRFVLSGRANYGPKRYIAAGEVAYFPEGVFYGPEESEGDRLGLTWQFGGAGGLGLISERQSREATAALKQTGKFERGIYYPAEPAGRKAQDSYEAVWEHVNGRRITYPKPRYDEPILMRTEHFVWQDQPGQRGVEAKLLGVFTERRLEIAMLRVAGGSHAMLGPRDGLQTVYTVTGTGTVDGAALAPQTAFEVKAGTAAQVIATTDIDLIVVGLPIFVRAKQRTTA
jgi:hypothetical protein